MVRFYQAGSSEMYGKAVEIRSAKPPRSTAEPVCAAKVYAFWQTLNYREAYGLFAVNGILFNHESPRRGENLSPQNHAERRANQTGSRTSSDSAILAPNAIGVSPATTSKRCG